MFLILWLNEHRMLVVIVMGVALWGGAYGFYFRMQIRSYLRRGKPHDWSVDMLTKRAISRGKEQV